MKKLLFISILLSTYSLIAQNLEKGTPIDGKTFVIKASEFTITQPIYEEFDKSKSVRKIMKDKAKRKPQVFVYGAEDGEQYGEAISVRQTKMGNKAAIPTIKNLSGLSSFSDPLDPTGAPSLNKYVQSINSTPFRVYDKTSGSILFNGSVGTITGVTNDGDPIVLYDKFADRWLIAQLGTGNQFALAISKTNDPAGQYYAYKFTATQFPDYLKFSIWQNGYYMTSNGTSFIYCFERDKMLVGDASARAIVRTFSIPNNAGFGFWLPLPADADGLIPPSGARCPMFSYTDNGWGGSNTDAIKIWSMGVTWGTTPSADITLDATIPTASFDASYSSWWEDITQPNTTQKIDGLGGVCMYRAQWRKWTGYNSVVLNWAVKVSSTTRAIRWCEIRQNQTSGTWSLYQEGTYSPDAHSRWNGSIAMDDNGSIALCYAKSSSTVSPSLAFTARNANDPLGQMTYDENVVATGSGAIETSNRFGDYSHTAIDPSDQLTFWHTGMYCLNSSGNTKIYSFKVPSNVGIDEYNKQTEITIYQKDKNIIVKADNLPYNNENYIVDIFDLSGKQIQVQEIKVYNNSINTNINIQGFSKATYLVRIGHPKFQKVTKININ